MVKTEDRQPPVIVLGGIENALSVARSLGKRGVKVYISVSKNSNVLHSKYCTRGFPYSNSKTVQAFWANLLLGGENNFPHGSVILPCNDSAIEFVAKKRDELVKKYRLDDFMPEIHLAMLDKKQTLELAKPLGIGIPNFWEINNLADLKNIEDEIVFPVIIKPINSHLFQMHFNYKKYFFANNLEELRQYMKKVIDFKIEVMIAEFIPGPDSLLGSYYTYIDSNDKPLFHYTKKIIRRFPQHEGLGCCHKTEWDEEIAEVGYKYFQGINFRGLGNLEFKRDLRDGRLKLIECNPRFTASQELIARSGMDIAVIVYNHIVGLPLPGINSYKQNLRFWFPVRDFHALRELRRKNEITVWEWLKSVFHQPVFPYFRWSDPLPSVKVYAKSLKPYLKKADRRKK